MSVPITAIIALLGIFIGAWFQRRHWLRSVAEEIRVRETKDASELIELIARTFDKRIVAQRLFIFSIGDPSRADEIVAYRGAIKLYFEDFNTIRSKLFYYFSYKEVLEYEKELHNRLATSGLKVDAMYKKYRNSRQEDVPRNELNEINRELSNISAMVYMHCRKLYEAVSRGDFGTLRRVDDWRNPKNEFSSSFKLIRRALNI